jgi:heterotetrameric sarcosine oxidase gamma subunit
MPLATWQEASAQTSANCRRGASITSRQWIVSTRREQTSVDGRSQIVGADFFGRWRDQRPQTFLSSCSQLSPITLAVRASDPAAQHRRGKVGKVAARAHALRIADLAKLDQLAAGALVMGDPLEERAVVALRFSLRLDPSLLSTISQAAGLVFDVPINRRVVLAERAALRLGPDAWLLSGPESAADQVARDVAAALAGRQHALVDVSQLQVALAVTGSKAADVSNSGCPLDLSPPVCAIAFAARALLGKAEMILAKTKNVPSSRSNAGARSPPTFASSCSKLARDCPAQP